MPGILARAKVNLHLHITGKRADGYHDLDSLTAFIDIGDYLTVSPSDIFKIDFTGPFANDLNMSLSSLSSVEKAARYFVDFLNHDLNVHIKLEKNIPLGAGLGGGSADAAVCLKALNKLWNANVSVNDLQSIGVKIGADVPACFAGETCIMRGIGDVIETAPVIPALPMVMVWPNRQVSTIEVYKNVGQENITENFQFKDQYSDIHDFVFDLQKTRNDLQLIAVKLFPEIELALNTIAKTKNCLMSRMTGSGGSVFGIFENQGDAQQAADEIAMSHPDWWVKYATTAKS